MHTSTIPGFGRLQGSSSREYTTAPVGIRDCGRFSVQLLRDNTYVTVPPAEQAAALRALARQMWQAGLVRAPAAGIAVHEAEDEGVTDMVAVLVAGTEKAVIESGMKRRATAKACAAEQARAKEIEAFDLVKYVIASASLC